MGGSGGCHRAWAVVGGGGAHISGADLGGRIGQELIQLFGVQVERGANGDRSAKADVGGVHDRAVEADEARGFGRRRLVLYGSKPSKAFSAFFGSGFHAWLMRGGKKDFFARKTKTEPGRRSPNHCSFHLSRRKRVSCIKKSDARRQEPLMCVCT